MAKYYATVIEAWVDIVPESRIQFKNALTGEVTHGSTLPERRFEYPLGKRLTFGTKKEVQAFKRSPNGHKVKFDGD